MYTHLIRESTKINNSMGKIHRLSNLHDIQSLDKSDKIGTHDINKKKSDSCIAQRY